MWWHNWQSGVECYYSPCYIAVLSKWDNKHMQSKGISKLLIIVFVLDKMSPFYCALNLCLKHKS